MSTTPGAFPPVPQAAGTPAAAQNAPPFLVLRGMPLEGRVGMVGAAMDKHPVLVLPGNARFLALPGERPLGPDLFFGSPRLDIQVKLPRVPCINGMGNADIYGMALTQSLEFVQRMGTPCLNHPQAVLGTTRDAVAQTLAGIDGLQVPPTARVNAARVAELVAAVDAAGLSYPLIARMAGDRRGTGLVRVEHAQDWEALNGLPWGGRDIYLTPFIDCRDADGLYRSVRIAVVGQELVPCHAWESADWLFRAAGLPAAEGDVERKFKQGFAAALTPALRAALMEAAARLKLDCFAIDGCLRPDGRLLVFEASAVNPTPRDLGLNPPLVAAVRRLLSAPRSWRHAPA